MAELLHTFSIFNQKSLTCLSVRACTIQFPVCVHLFYKIFKPQDSEYPSLEAYAAFQNKTLFTYQGKNNANTYSTYLYISSKDTSLTSPFSASSFNPFVKPFFENIK